MTAAAEITVYSRRGCHLCEDLIGELEPLLKGRARLRVVDIDGDPGLRKIYHERVPVVCGGEDELCQHFLDRGAVLAWLDRGIA